MTVIVDFGPGIEEPDYLFGIISPAGWAGAATLDVPYGIAWPVLVEPSSAIEFVVAGNTPKRESRYVVAKLEAGEWKSGDAIHLLVTNSMIQDAITGKEPLVEQRPSIIDSAAVHELINCVGPGRGSWPGPPTRQLGNHRPGRLDAGLARGRL